MFGLSGPTCIHIRIEREVPARSRTGDTGTVIAVILHGAVTLVLLRSVKTLQTVSTHFYSVHALFCLPTLHEPAVNLQHLFARDI